MMYSYSQTIAILVYRQKKAEYVGLFGNKGVGDCRAKRAGVSPSQ